MPHRILSCDLLICDQIVPLAEHPELHPLIARYNEAHPEHPIIMGSKSPLSAIEYQEWFAAVNGAGTFVPGGSAANTLSALKQLLADKIEIHFISAYGDDAPGRVVAAALRQDGFHLLPGQQANATVQTALSIVLVGASGERSILGYPGNVRQAVLQGMQQCALPDFDILFLPGSAWQKYGAEFAERLLTACNEQQTLWLSLPTHSQAGITHDAAIRAVLPRAQVVLANASELLRLSGCAELPVALEWLASVTALGFITDGNRGAYVLSEKNITHVPPDVSEIPDGNSTLGAGDAAFAGFLYGQLTQQSAVQSAHMAMRLAAEKMHQPGARLQCAHLAGKL